jgi:CRISPR-associated protein Csm2
MAYQPQQQNNQERFGRGSDRQTSKDDFEKLDTSDINLKVVNAELFSDIAKSKAKVIAKNSKSNKSTQLRKFYDEIVMWDQKLMMISDKAKQAEKFIEYLPFIKMLNAKVAYAEGRKNSGNGLVDPNFVMLISDCLKQVDSPETMRTFKLFMEAFMGFYKQVREKD